MRTLTILVLAGCSMPRDGLRATPPGDGPEVVVDWDAEPLPELPFPNDLATLRDPSSPTGLRVNIAGEAHTEYESIARHKLDELTGFGIYAPISVSFDQRLDLDEILRRHPDDFYSPTAFDDDAFYLIDIDPDSPDYGKPVALDVGHGRYPMDVFQNDRYFPNDPRSNSPSLLFETYEEDLDGDGELDPGEDSDNDGILDHPNVWPPGSDPVQNLLSWYDLETNTLLLRPVAPLREETTYAMVLTNRLIGEAGEPVRSPWAWVHHTRQYDALSVLPDALGGLGLGIDDVAFTWTFTTGRVTGDLRDLHAALYDGKGPYKWIGEQYPGGIEEALQVQNIDGVDAWNLPSRMLMDVLLQVGGIEVANLDLILAAYRQYSDRLVAGSFTTPYLLTDADDGGIDDSDEWWKLNPATGEAVVGPDRVIFNCVLPTEREGVSQPFPTMIYGHGYGSNRLETLYFGYVFNRIGWAVCGIDFPGHGIENGDDTLQAALSLLKNGPLGPALHNLLDNRARDLDNDGLDDSGGDQWAADPFHTRDMVRQGVLDWMQYVRSLRACGTGTMRLVNYADDGSRVDSGESAVACDWDGDGTPDIGGGAPIAIAGGSLGGINGGVAAGVMPEVSSFALVVPGGGIVDIGVRTEIGGAVEAFVGRLMNPIILGYPEGESLRLVQMVNSVTDMRELPIATIPTIPAGGRVVLTNLNTGEVREAAIPADGRLRVSIAADALDAGEKKLATGMPGSGPEPGVIYEVPDNDGLGDPLTIELYDADGQQVASIDAWETDVLHEGVTMRAGSPLVAAADGNGKIRGSSDARRLAFVLAMALEPGDAIAYAPHYFREPFADLGGQPQNVLLMPNPGDPIVAVNSGVALARAAGLVPWWEIDPRYGTTVDRFLIDHGVVRGIEERGPYTNADGVPLLYDIDDLDEGTDGSGAPSPEQPVRSTVTTSKGQSALRMAYVWPQGTHGFVLDAEQEFDWTSYVLQFVGDYSGNLGAEVRDRLCYETADCPELPPVVLDEEAP
ncbi:MAG TPA: hypothetical protein PKA64_08230 [Myxococcota bacterium]|nr:hypothetical protein [Myxococcota bacterium]